jgi:hypothetical protein
MQEGRAGIKIISKQRRLVQLTGQASNFLVVFKVVIANIFR